MKKEIIQKMRNQFDALARAVPEENIEFWFAQSNVP